MTGTLSSTRTLAAAVAALAIAVSAGCGQSGGADAGGSPTATAPTSSAPASAASSPATPGGSDASPSGSGSATGSGSTTDTTQAPRDQSGVEPILITLTDGKVTPNGEKMNVAKGTRITLQITSDHDDAVHVHGFDVEQEVKAGEPATLTFIADQVGSFEVESHHPAKVILILNVR